MAYTDRFIEMYKEVAKGGQLTEAEVIALGQPPAPGLRIYKVFRYLVQLIEQVSQPGAEQIRAEVAAQLAQLTRAEINKQVDARVSAAKAELESRFEAWAKAQQEANHVQINSIVEMKWRRFKQTAL